MEMWQKQEAKICTYNNDTYGENSFFPFHMLPGENPKKDGAIPMWVV